MLVKVDTGPFEVCGEWRVPRVGKTAIAPATHCQNERADRSSGFGRERYYETGTTELW